MISAKEMSVAMDLSLATIYYRAKKLGLKASGRWTKKEAYQILNYEQEKPGRKPVKGIKA